MTLGGRGKRSEEERRTSRGESVWLVMTSSPVRTGLSFEVERRIFSGLTEMEAIVEAWSGRVRSGWEVKWRKPSVVPSSVGVKRMEKVAERPASR